MSNNNNQTNKSVSLESDHTSFIKGTLKCLCNFGWLFPLIFLATLLQNYYDLSALMSEGTLQLHQHEGPIIYKITKDIIYLVMMSAIIFNSLKNGNLPFNAYSALFLLLISGMAIISSIENSPLVALYGFRWIFPFLLFMLMGSWYRKINTSIFLYVLITGLITCFTLQIYQLFYMPPVFGEILPGIPARTTGFFIAPNSTAFFGCTSAACVMVIAHDKLKLQFVSVLLSFLISFMSQSGTGLVASLLLTLWFFCRKHNGLFFLISCLSVLLVFPNLDFLSGRGEGYLAVSGGERINILLKILSDSGFSVGNFGIYTNTANLSSTNPEDQIPPDSLLAAWIGNLGIYGAISIVIAAVFLVFGIRDIHWRRAFPCVLVFAVFSLTTIVFEAFPMNLFLAFGIWSARRPSENDR